MRRGLRRSSSFFDPTSRFSLPYDCCTDPTEFEGFVGDAQWYACRFCICSTHFLSSGTVQTFTLSEPLAQLPSRASSEIVWVNVQVVKERASWIAWLVQGPPTWLTHAPRQVDALSLFACASLFMSNNIYLKKHPRSKRRRVQNAELNCIGACGLLGHAKVGMT